MKRFLLVLPAIALLGGCGAGGFIERETGLSPAQQQQIGARVAQFVVATAQATPCLLAAGAPAGSYVSQDAELACRAEGRTVPGR